MRRALILIITLTAIAFGLGYWCDVRQTQTAETYLSLAEAIRQPAAAGNFDTASREEAYFTARWQQDSKWLKCLISHHHIREVDEGLTHLRTALDAAWVDEALLALGEITDALEDVRTGHIATWVNVL